MSVTNCNILIMFVSCLGCISVVTWKQFFSTLIEENVLDTRKGKKLDLTTFKDNLPEHSVDLHAACPRCLAAEASKPGANDGESVFIIISRD